MQCEEERSVNTFKVVDKMGVDKGLVLLKRLLQFKERPQTLLGQ